MSKSITYTDLIKQHGSASGSGGYGAAPLNPISPVRPTPMTNVNLNVDPQVLLMLERIAKALELIATKMGSGFA